MKEEREASRAGQAAAAVHGNTMKLFCQRANDDFVALWITALYYSALLYTHSTIEQIAQKCRMTTKKTGNAYMHSQKRSFLALSYRLRAEKEEHHMQCKKLKFSNPLDSFFESFLTIGAKIISVVG